MQNQLRWYKGLSVSVMPSDGKVTDRVILTYKERNKLESKDNNNIYFNESLFPFVSEGLVIYIDIDPSHIMKSYEILDILEGGA